MKSFLIFSWNRYRQVRVLVEVEFELEIRIRVATFYLALGCAASRYVITLSRYAERELEFF